MKFAVDRDALLKSLSHVQSAVERRNTVPILGNVKLAADQAGGRLLLTTTDMELEINETLAVSVTAGGATTVPAHTLFEIIRKLPDTSKVELALDEKGTTVTVKAGRSQFRLSCLPAADFPELGAGDYACSFKIPANVLRTLIDKTKFAMSSDEARHYLNGIYIHHMDVDGVAMLRAAATDGHRLARFEMPLPSGAEDMPAIILPRKAVTEIRKLIEDAGDAVEIAISPNKARFTFNQVVLTTRLIDGTYPEYERVIPKDNNNIIEVDPKALTAAVDRVSTISDKTRSVKLAVSGKTLTLSAQAADSGSATEEVEINNDTTQIEIGFNARYLLDCSTLIEGDACRIAFADLAAPVVVKDSGDPSALYVLMPMRV